VKDGIFMVNNRQTDWDDQKLAVVIQKALLDSHIPQCDCGRIVVKNRMCDAVGGDFYHFRKLNSDQVAFAIGDVLGHGTSAALIMAIIMGILRGDRQNQSRPSRILEGINDLLIELGGKIGMPTTCSLIYGVVDLPSGNLFYTNAGHPHPIVCNRVTGTIRHLGPTTMLLGVQGHVREESCHQFAPEDRIILFTDGLLESVNEDQEFFGQDRLDRVIQAGSAEPPEKQAEAIFAEIDRFSGYSEHQDDQTLVVIDFTPLSGKS